MPSLLPCLLAATLAGASLWEPLAPLPEGNAGLLHAYVGDRLIVAGGKAFLNQVLLFPDAIRAYDAAGHRWQQIGTLPHRFHYGAFAAYDGSFQMIGGSDGTAMHTDAWTIDSSGHARKFAELPQPVGYTGSAYWGRSAYLLGGTRNVRDVSRLTADFLRLDLVTGALTRLPDYPGGPMLQIALAAGPTRLWAFTGGSYDAATHKLVPSAAAWSYDIGAGKWHAIAPYPFPVRAVTACLLDDDHILLAGGTVPPATPDGVAATSACFLYEISADRYRTLPPLPYLAMLVGLQKAGDLLYLIGGEDKGRHRVEQVRRVRIADLIAAAGGPTPAPGKR